LKSHYHMETNKQPHILLAEDDPNLGLLLAEFLKKKGFQVTWAQNGDQALDFLCKGPLTYVSWMS